MDNPVITLKDGKIRGAAKTLLDGSPYYSFKGIRYAQPPVGKLRFRAPHPVEPWEGIRDAIEHGPPCPQCDIFQNTIQEGDEDCLFLNVYSKTLDPESKTSVMVYIHGGGFLAGSGNSELYGPEFLLQHDVILVTINYRLELLGFLNLDTPEVPGNAGMKDQVAALRWVQQNISKFGGDADNVTIFGESAGGISVTYHMLSLMSEDLFHKVIAQSGVCTMDLYDEEKPIEKAFRAGKILGKETNNPDELLDFLQSLPTEKLIDHLTTKMTKRGGIELQFSPVVEKRFENVEAFISEEPLNMIKRKNIKLVPLMIGCNSLEGILDVKNLYEKLDLINKHPEAILSVDIVKEVNKNKLEEFGQRVKKFYVGNRDFTKNDAEILYTVSGDLHFLYHAHRFANMYSMYHKEIYLYRFNWDTDLNLFKKMFSRVPNIKGASHADELTYLFSGTYSTEIYRQNEKLRDMINKLTKLWTNFAKLGNPTPDEKLGSVWHPYTTHNKEYFNIDDTFCMGDFKDGDRDRMMFLNTLYKEVGLPTII